MATEQTVIAHEMKVFSCLLNGNISLQYDTRVWKVFSNRLRSVRGGDYFFMLTCVVKIFHFLAADASMYEYTICSKAPI